MVWIDRKKFSDRAGWLPAAMATAIVSPTARDNASRNAAMMPDNAAGSTIRTLTSNLVEPSASPASRSPRGTERNTSSLSEEIVGTIITPTTIPALSTLNPCTGMPNKPVKTGFRI